MPNESLADISLTELGAEQLMTAQNGQQLMEGKKSEWERVKKEPLGEPPSPQFVIARSAIVVGKQRAYFPRTAPTPECTHAENSDLHTGSS